MSDLNQHQKAFLLLKEGKRQESIQILLRLLKQNQKDEKALWLFANATENPAHKREIVNRILKQNPDHEGAKKLLAKLESAPPQKTVTQKKSTTKKAATKNNSVRTAAIVLVITALIVAAFAYFILPKPYTGVLLLGNEAIVRDRLRIVIFPPQEFDGLSRAQIYQQRTEAVHYYPNLISDNYEPDNRVFGQIEDGKLWWGMIGQWIAGTRNPNIQNNDGASEESRLVLNPYILVSPEFIGLSVYGTDDGRFWQDGPNVYSSEFPHHCLINRLTWDAVAREAISVYDVSSCMDDMDNYTLNPLLLPANGEIALYAYNARDFDLNYIYVDYDASENVSKQNPPNRALAIPHYIHSGETCGIAGGCNNMSPTFEPLENILIESVPSSLRVKLWQHNPVDVNSDADMTMVIHFR